MVAMAGSERPRGCGKYSNPPYPVFPAADDTLEHPAAKPRHCDIGIVIPPFGRLDVNGLVDVERAPYPSGASRHSAACSNTRVSPLIHPYHPHHHTLMKILAPPPK
jgi:hypothetical protein